MNNLSTAIWSPTRGGLDTASACYPGFPSITDQQHQMAPGDALWINLKAQDLLTLTISLAGSELLIAALRFDLDTNSSSLCNKIYTAEFMNNLPLSTSFAQGHIAGQAETQHSAECRFDCRLIERHLVANQMQLNDLQWHSLTQDAAQWVIKAEINYSLILAVPITNTQIVESFLPANINFNVSIEHCVNIQNQTTLPPALGLVRDEFRIPRATGRAYQVKKGEYIQVIDVEGRQCSDFMAMNTQALNEGKERYIDATVTRSLTASAYPQPGLSDKFYDQDMQPLLAVIQDTVGRHDTFALACTEYGYAERGFAGHVNCSDNISMAYAPYGIESRKAWPAINFFFNSSIDPNNHQLSSDESWSRPGDYVLMKALTDLTCVSTACPDDIDPINGWNPTDIHIRVYDCTANIPRSIAYRSLPESAPFMSIETPFHPRTRALTQRFQNARNYWLPKVFDSTGAIGEYWNCRENVTVQDMSNLRKLDIYGPDSEKLLQLALSRDISRLSVHRGLYALLCSAQGHLIDDGTLFRLSADLFRWCCGSDESARQLQQLAREHNLKVWIKDFTLKLCNMAIQGPRSRDLLRKLVFTQPTQPSLDNLRWFGCTIARSHNRDGIPFMLTRTGFTGELGYEIFCDHRDAIALWDLIFEAGKEFNISPMGTDALELLRVEAALMINGAEFSGDIEPDEAGVGFAVDMRNEVFSGRRAIERNRLAPRKQLVGLKIQGEEIPHRGDTVYLARQPIGTVTSAIRSPQLKQVIAMARIPVELAKCGQMLEVGRLDGHMKRLHAAVCHLPFIDPQRIKARS